MNEPFYMVELLVAGCNHKLKLNDITISESEDGDQISCDIKINQWVKNGVNELTLEMTPIEDDGKLFDDTTGKLRVLLYEASNLGVSGQPINQEQTPKFPNEESEDALNKFVLQLTFVAKLPFENPVFYESKVFNLKEHSELLLSKFRQIWTLHQEQSWSDLIQLEKTRNLDLAQRFYEPLETMETMNLNNFKETVNEGYSLVGFDLEFLRLKLHAHGRLATLEDTAGFPAIFYDHEDGSYHFYPYYVCFNSLNEIVVIR